MDRKVFLFLSILASCGANAEPQVKPIPFWAGWAVLDTQAVREAVDAERELRKRDVLMAGEPETIRTVSTKLKLSMWHEAAETKH